MGKDGAKRVIEALLYTAFFLGLLLPFLPGYVEFRFGKDNGALSIDQNYARDPRFFGKSFRAKAAPMMTSEAVGTRTQFLDRKREFVRVVHGIDIPDGERIDDILLSLGPINAGGGVSLLDVYARARVVVGPGSHVRTLSTDANAVLGEGTLVARWVDVEHDLAVARGCDLGQSASAGGLLIVDTDTSFKRIFGRPIIVGWRDTIVAPQDDSGVTVSMVPTGVRELGNNVVVVGAEERIKSDIVASGNVDIGENATLYGSIKSSKNVMIGAEARVYGNVVARADIFIGEGARVFGHVFADGNVLLGNRAVVGSAALPKTLYSGGSVELSIGSSTYGWVITERGGKTVAGA